MLPKRAIILFMHADGVFDGFDLTRHVHHMRVKVVNCADAIATKLEAVGHSADAVFPDVKGILFVVGSSGIAIWHLHLRQRRPVQDWTYTTLILVGELMKYEALTRGKADPKTPFLPAYLIAVHSKARTLGL